jgi:hypothetical protein
MDCRAGAVIRITPQVFCPGIVFGAGSRAFALRDRMVSRVVIKLYVAGRWIMAAFVTAWALCAFWMIVDAPRFRADYQRQLSNEISDENRVYCARWGFVQGTHEYNLCQLDLSEIRAKEDVRLTSPL